MKQYEIPELTPQEEEILQKTLSLSFASKLQAMKKKEEHEKAI
jgi:hypothetical protein